MRLKFVAATFAAIGVLALVAAPAEGERQLGGERPRSPVRRIAGNPDPHHPSRDAHRAAIVAARAAGVPEASSVIVPAGNWCRNQVS